MPVQQHLRAKARATDLNTGTQAQRLWQAEVQLQVEVIPTPHATQHSFQMPLPAALALCCVAFSSVCCLWLLVVSPAGVP